MIPMACQTAEPNGLMFLIQIFYSSKFDFKKSTGNAQSFCFPLIMTIYICIMFLTAGKKSKTKWHVIYFEGNSIISLVGGNKKKSKFFFDFDLKTAQATPDPSAFYKTKFCIFIYIS